MRHRHVTILVAGLVVLASACGSGDSASPAVGASASTNAPAETGDGGGGIRGAIEVAAAAPGQADDAACTIDRQTLQTASEMYLMLNGSLPQSQDALVEAELIRERSPRFEIDAQGAIVAAPESPCS